MQMCKNEGEADFIVEYVPRLNPPMGVAYLKTILLCIVIFFRFRLYNHGIQ